MWKQTDLKTKTMPDMQNYDPEEWIDFMFDEDAQNDDDMYNDND